MIRTISWIISSVFQNGNDPVNKEQEEESEVAFEATVMSEDETELKDQEGVITHYNRDYGIFIIDRTHQVDDYLMARGFEPKKDMTVTYCARYTDESGWAVTSVKPVLDEKQQLIMERKKRRVANFVILQFLKGSDKVKLTMGKAEMDFISIPRSLFPQEYPLLTGDWFKVEMEVEFGTDTEEATILAVEWLEKAEVTEHLVKQDGIWMVDRVYVPQKLVTERKASEKSLVKVIAVESDQTVRVPGTDRIKIFKKRAVDLIVETKPNRSTQDEEEEIEAWFTEYQESPEQVQRNRMQELSRDKFGLKITPVIPVVSVQAVGHMGEKLIHMENRGLQDVVLKEISVEGIQDVCEVKVVNLDDGDISPWTVIHAGETIAFKIQCVPKEPGRTKELVLFDFGEFRMGREIIVLMAQDDDRSLNSNVANRKSYYAQGELSRTAFSSNAEVVSVIPVKPPFFVPNELEKYPIPPLVELAYENDNDMLLKRQYPTVDFSVLNAKNYVDRFSLALYLEEMEQTKIRRDTSLYDVTLVKLIHTDLHSLSISGDHELGFQIQRSDKILVENVGDPNINFGGYVEKTVVTETGQEIHIKLSEKFSYGGEGVNVQFLVSRSPFRRQHFAIRHAAHYLGSQWLFPQALVTKPPRIVVLEDKLEPFHPTMNTPLYKKGGEKKDRFQKPLGFRAPMIRAVESKVHVINSEIMKKPKLRWFNHSLNQEQRNAVRGILRAQARPLPYIVFGPPGTGKTVTVVEAVMQIYFTEKISRILVTAPSNHAADIITELLISTNRFKPGDLVRLNGFLRSEMDSPETIADFCRDAECMESIAKHRLIISTVTNAGKFYDLSLYTGHFSHVFIDEAGYCTEPEAMIPAVLAAIDREGQIILVGDPKQLGPVLKCTCEVNSILNKSFLERIMENRLFSRDEEKFPETKYNPLLLTKLVKNYRSHPLLLKVASSLFYHNELQPHANEEERSSLAYVDFLQKPGVPLIFHGVQGKCCQDLNSPSCYNLAEAKVVADYVKMLKNAGVSDDDIGIITSYRKQVEKIRIELTFSLLQSSESKVASVQEFQGAEKQVIIISTVRSDLSNSLQNQNLDFLYSEKLFNVAVTRAKALMIIVGDPHLLHQSECWGAMLQHCIDLGAYRGCDLPIQVNKKLLDVLDEIVVPE